MKLWLLFVRDVLGWMLGISAPVLHNYCIYAGKRKLHLTIDVFGLRAALKIINSYHYVKGAARSRIPLLKLLRSKFVDQLQKSFGFFFVRIVTGLVEDFQPTSLQTLRGLAGVSWRYDMIVSARHD